MTARKTTRFALLCTGVALAMTAHSASEANAAHSKARVAPPERIVLARQSYTDVIAGLEMDGYRVVSMSSTMLGRVKILAKNRVHLREIVVSRSTGEIKHDVILKVFKLRKEDSRKTNRKTQTRRSVDTDSGDSSGAGGGLSVGVGGDSGVSAGVGGGGVSASVGGSGGANVSAGGGGVSANVGGLGVSLGN